MGRPTKEMVAAREAYLAAAQATPKEPASWLPEAAWIESDTCFSQFAEGKIVLQIDIGRHKISGSKLEAVRKYRPDLLRNE